MADAPFAPRVIRRRAVRCERHVKQAEPLVVAQNLETSMKLVKISAIAAAISALLAGPVLAQGAPSDAKVRGGAQGKTHMQGSASGSADEDINADATGRKAGATAKSGMKATVGTGSGKVTGGAIAPATGR
jgi:hypothetical protein